MYYFRLVEPDFSPMLVYDVLKEHMTSDQARILYPGVHQEDHWALAYEGPWQTRSDPAAELGTYRFTDSAQAALSFAFEGAGLWLRTGPDADGELAFILDGQALASRPSTAAEMIPLAQNLGRGPHMISMQAASGSLSVDSLTIERRRAVNLWLVAGIVGVAAVMIAVLFAVLATQRRSWYHRSRAPR